LKKYYQHNIELDELKQEIKIPKTYPPIDRCIDEDFRLMQFNHIKHIITDREFFIYQILNIYLEDKIRTIELKEFRPLYCYVDFMLPKLISNYEIF